MIWFGLVGKIKIANQTKPCSWVKKWSKYIQTKCVFLKFRLNQSTTFLLDWFGFEHSIVLDWAWLVEKKKSAWGGVTFATPRHVQVRPWQHIITSTGKTFLHFLFLYLCQFLMFFWNMTRNTRWRIFWRFLVMRHV